MSNRRQDNTTTRLNVLLHNSSLTPFIDRRQESDIHCVGDVARVCWRPTHSVTDLKVSLCQQQADRCYCTVRNQPSVSTTFILLTEYGEV